MEQVLDDVVRVFHHPAIRDQSCELHRNMFNAVERWVQSLPQQGANLNRLLSRDSVRNGGNHTQVQGQVQGQPHGPGHSPAQGLGGGNGGAFNPSIFGMGNQSTPSGSPFDMLTQKAGGLASSLFGQSAFPGSGRREFGEGDMYGQPYQTSYQQGYEAPYSSQAPPEQQHGQQGYNTYGEQEYTGQPSAGSSGYGYGSNTQEQYGSQWQDPNRRY